MAGVSIDISNLVAALDQYVGEEFKDRMANATLRAVKRVGEKSKKGLDNIVANWIDEVRFVLTPSVDFEKGIASFEISVTDDSPEGSKKASGADIFRFIDEGTEPHDIPLEPKPYGNSLEFKIPDVGLIYAQQVHDQFIPKPDPSYTDNIVKTIENELPDILILEIRRELDAMEKEGVYERPTRDNE